MKAEELLIENFRPDGRIPTEQRDISLKFNVKDNSAGSCLFSQGTSKTVAWVVGPKEGGAIRSETGATLKVDFQISSFAGYTWKKRGKQELKIKEFSNTIKEVFSKVILVELYKRAEIELKVVLLQEDGSFKSCVFNAITCALINAGIEMRDTAVGITLLKTPENTLVDPIRVEEQNNCSLVNILYLPTFKEFAFVEMTNGRVSYSEFKSLLTYCEQNAEYCFNGIKEQILAAII